MRWQFFWTVLDFRKQGFLDAFTLDYFLRDLVLKIQSHDEDDETTTPEQIRVRCTAVVLLDVARLLTQERAVELRRPRCSISWLRKTPRASRGRTCSSANLATVSSGQSVGVPLFQALAAISLTLENADS